MIPNNNISVLPFYTDVSKQNHNKSYAYGDKFPLITPFKTVLPFQIQRPTSAFTIDNIVATLVSLDGTINLDITSKLIATGLLVNSYASEGYDVIMYKSQPLFNYPIDSPLDIAVTEGLYQIELFDGSTTYISDIFSMTVRTDDYVRIEYSNDESIEIADGIIDFSNDFKFVIYLNTKIGRPDYEFEEQVTKRDGYQFIEKQISEKTYKFVFLAPEYLCDAMRIIRLSDNINVSVGYDSYTVDTFLITPKWQDGGYLASVDTEFQCDTVIKKIGARVVAEDNTDPSASEAGIFVGYVPVPVPDEATVRSMPGRSPIKVNVTEDLNYDLNKYQAISYPSSFGNLGSITNNDNGFELKNAYNKINHDFTFGSNVVNMNTYVFKKPIKTSMQGVTLSKTFKFI